MIGLADVGQQSSVDLRVQSLDSAVEALGKTRDLFDRRYREPSGGDDSRSAAGGDHLHVGRVQATR